LVCWKSDYYGSIITISHLGYPDEILFCKIEGMNPVRDIGDSILPKLALLNNFI
jgi:hypothetical protein